MVAGPVILLTTEQQAVADAFGRALHELRRTWTDDEWDREWGDPRWAPRWPDAPPEMVPALRRHAIGVRDLLAMQFLTMPFPRLPDSRYWRRREEWRRRMDNRRKDRP